MLKPSGENSKKAQKNLEKQKLEEKKALNKLKQKEMAKKKLTQKSNVITKGNEFKIFIYNSAKFVQNFFF